MSDIAVAALLAGTILLASTVSIEIGISVALIELLLGVVVGNAFHLDVPSWLAFIGSFAGIVLIFLAGAEVDVPQFRREWRASLSIGLVSFSRHSLSSAYSASTPLTGRAVRRRSAGCALNDKSGRRLRGAGRDRPEPRASRQAADVGNLRHRIATVIGLTVLFVKPTLWIVPFALVSVGLILVLPKLSPWFFSRYGDRVIEPEIKLVFACLFLLMWLGTRANSQAALPAFVLGLVMSSHYVQHRQEQDRMRVVAFAFLTPFFFLKGGMNVSTGALWGNLGILALLFVGKMVPKLTGVFPLARRYTAPHAVFTTLLMSTGLTFGTITSLYGLSAHIIDRTQFSLLIAVVVLSAIVPTAIAQRFYSPTTEEQRDLTAPVAPAGLWRTEQEGEA